MGRRSGLSKYILGGAAVLGVGLLLFGRGSSPVGVGVSPRGAVLSESIPTGSPTRNTGGAKQNLAPDFNLERLGGGTITLSEFRGKKPVVVDFWASWCPNCRRDMPNLNRYYEKYKDQVEVIGVNLQESRNAVESFIASRNISFPIAFDPYGLASQAFGIQYTNTHFLIDKEGKVIRVIPGDISELDFKSLLDG